MCPKAAGNVEAVAVVLFGPTDVLLAFSYRRGEPLRALLQTLGLERLRGPRVVLCALSLVLSRIFSAVSCLHTFTALHDTDILHRRYEEAMEVCCATRKLYILWPLYCYYFP